MNERPYITCRELIEHLDDYIAAALPDQAREDVDRHLGACTSCVAYTDSYRRTIELATRLRDEP